MPLNQCSVAKAKHKSLLLPFISQTLSNKWSSASFHRNFSKKFKCCGEDTFFDTQVRQWYELESYGIYKSADPRSVADKRAVRFLESSRYHDQEWYIVGMLWFENDTPYPNSYYSALAYLYSREKDSIKTSVWSNATVRPSRTISMEDTLSLLVRTIHKTALLENVTHSIIQWDFPTSQKCY